MKKIIIVLLVCFLLAGIAFAENIPEPTLYRGTGNDDLVVTTVSIDNNNDSNEPMLIGDLDTNIGARDPRLREIVRERVKDRVEAIIARSINAVRHEYQRQFAVAVKDANEEIKEELQQLRQAINTRIRQEIKAKRVVDYSDYNGLGQKIIIAKEQIEVRVKDAIDSNIIPITARIQKRVHDRLIEIRNDRNKIEIVDGNVVVETDEEVTIDDNGLHVRGRKIRVLPNAIKMKAREKIELHADGNTIQYRIDAKNTRYVLGFIPVQAQEKIRINAETGELEGYERPWWTFLATGTDVDANVELTE
ncbi:MAG: hypothetical protein HOE11_02720 [Candidatus Diapherotrites archaeon]|nr:hypothetical protein [Candidatus Diapherotrites archaeon]MBT4597009.1 hypothetical protein [Candidatus Diapherotrites archaeon]